MPTDHDHSHRHHPQLDADLSTCPQANLTPPPDPLPIYRRLCYSPSVLPGWVKNRPAFWLTFRPARGGWLTATVWTSDPPSRARVREEAASVVHRAAYLLAHGEALSLGEMLAQEGYAMARAGCTEPAADAGELAYTRQVLQPLLARRDRPTVMACLYGDRAAQSLGYRPLGLGDYAGLALALHRARAETPAT